MKRQFHHRVGVSSLRFSKRVMDCFPITKYQYRKPFVMQRSLAAIIIRNIVQHEGLYSYVNICALRLTRSLKRVLGIILFSYTQNARNVASPWSFQCEKGQVLLGLSFLILSFLALYIFIMHPISFTSHCSATCLVINNKSISWL